MPDTPLPPTAHETATLARPRRRRRFPWGWLLLLVLAAAGATWWYWDDVPEPWRRQVAALVARRAGETAPSGGTAGGAGRGGRFGGPVPVTVATAARADIPITLDALGTVQPLASAARVTALGAPAKRIRRVSARVSSPARPILPRAFSQSPKVPVERKLDGAVTSSRTMQPTAPSTRDSRSSSLTPTLPICGKVKVTICPA